MRIVFLGPPGAGKGTQAATLCEEEGIAHVATGDMFRLAVREGTPLGREVARYMEAGQLVPDQVTVAVVRDRLSRDDCRPGFLLDGFPRTVPQAQALDGMLAELGISLDCVVNIQVRDDELVRRLSGRRVCRGCGKIYNVYLHPPQQAGQCDSCGGDLDQRSDDREETVRERLRVYHAQTAPLVEYFRQEGKLLDVDGERPLSAVAAEIRAAVRAVCGLGA